MLNSPMNFSALRAQDVTYALFFRNEFGIDVELETPPFPIVYTEIFVAEYIPCSEANPIPKT